ncbi:hypothetical protein V1478_014774 [Vespula squamosa]|uniref:Uncharacterized protein n=1 Tax=Vespula squamosa TaxID=30214 RepID=A0ABD2A389_VESSQ
MATKSSLHFVVGHINRVLSVNSAEIIFILDGKLQKVYLKKEKYFHNGRIIPQDEPLFRYIKCGMKVKFSCQILKQQKQRLYEWVALMCWPMEQTLGLNVCLKVGMQYISGRISTLDEKHGVLITNDITGKEYKVYFLTSNFFYHGKKLDLSQNSLNEISSIDIIFFDAVPCIPEENEYNCEWYATCVFKGKRPSINNILPDLPIFDLGVNEILQTIENCFIKPNSMFLIGKGILLNVMNNDFGLILGEFQYNIFKEVLFHKNNTYVFKMCLDKYGLSDVLKRGDRMKFVAIGAPPGFFVEWIAIQVSVCDSGEYKTSKYDALLSRTSARLSKKKRTTTNATATATTITTTTIGTAAIARRTIQDITRNDVTRIEVGDPWSRSDITNSFAASRPPP